ADEGGGENPPHQRRPGQRQEGKPGRIERLVDTEEEQRKDHPPDHERRPAEHRHRVAHLGAGHRGAEESEPREAGRHEPKDQSKGEADGLPGMPAKAVNGQQELQPYEDAQPRRRSGCLRRGGARDRVACSPDRSAPVAVRPPATSTKTSSGSRPPPTSASAPAVRITPSAMMATWLQSFSTASMTWLEK